MFKVFSGSWRGIGANASPEVLFMQIGFQFRQHLHHFKGASLGVFMCIVLHANPQGESFPSYEQIRTETGINTDTIGRALEHLNNLEIDGQRVLLRYRIRDKKNRFVGGNRYIVFPSPDQLAQFEPSSAKAAEANAEGAPVEEPEQGAEDTPEQNKKSHIRIFPNLENSEQGKSALKENHSLKEIKNMAADAPARPSFNLEDRISAFPEDCQSGAKLIVSLFNLHPPEKPNPGQKGGEYALWIKGIRKLNKLAIEYNSTLDVALKASWKRWNQSPFTVAHPGALLKTMTSTLASTEQSQEPSMSLKSTLENVIKDFEPRS
ncbi:MAG: hypothetical protein CVU44_02355 [Chloroflexi bacterium HGW-Chloroflexi-6]|nr:MAG: hypothetical protein CVU44_02355 [Chloroflexi bacterium HGW-Chloroflexi-6]